MVYHGVLFVEKVCCNVVCLDCLCFINVIILSGFTKKSHLQRHMDTHTNKQYKCRSCPEVYSNVVDLKMHHRIVHERKM